MELDFITIALDTMILCPVGLSVSTHLAGDTLNSSSTRWTLKGIEPC